MVNCLLASCICEREAATAEPIRHKSKNDVTAVELCQTQSLPVCGLPDAAAEQCWRDRTRHTARTVQQILIPDQSSSDTGRYSITAVRLSADTTSASSNHTQDTVSQLHSKPRRLQTSWSWKILMTKLTLMLLLAIGDEGGRELRLEGVSLLHAGI